MKIPEVPFYLADVTALVRRGLVTVDEQDAEACCGIIRDADGFCSYRPSHPVYVRSWSVSVEPEAFVIAYTPREEND